MVPRLSTEICCQPQIAWSALARRTGAAGDAQPFHRRAACAVAVGLLCRLRFRASARAGLPPVRRAQLRPWGSRLAGRWRGLLGAGSLGAGGDAQPLDRRGGRLVLGLGFVGGVRPSASVGAGSASAAGAAFLAPGRLAPAAMPSPLAGAAGASAASVLASACGGAPPSWRPGRLAPPAMPSPLAGAAGAAAAGLGLAGPARRAPPRAPWPVPRRSRWPWAPSGPLFGLLRGRALLRQRRLVVVERPEQHLGDVEHLDAAAAGLLLRGR